MKPRSTRLNNTLRENFVKKVSEDKMPASTCPTETAFYDRWRTKVYDLAYKEHLPFIQQLPEAFFHKGKSVKVSFIVNKKSVVLEFQDDVKRLTRHGEGYYSSSGAMPIPDNHPLVLEYVELQQLKDDWAANKRQLESMLRQLVSNCNTSAQVYDAWPEAEKYSHLFPYTPPERHEGAQITQDEIDMQLKLVAKKLSSTL